MGILDRFGKGGASVAIELTAPTGKAGAALTGQIVITGGKRVQQIDGVKVWLAQTKSVNLTTGSAEACEDVMVAPRAIGARFEVEPGGSHRVPFELDLPKQLPSSRVKIDGQLSPVAVEYCVMASADIKGQIDPRGKTPVEIVDGVQIEITTR
jgi:sporulation-control protein spo0M